MCSRPSSRFRASLLGLLLFLPAVLAAAGCGKKGNPLPPIRPVPAPVRDLAVEQRGPSLRLSFTYPTTTPAGTALEGVTAVEVWEMVRPLPAGGVPRPPDPRELKAAARQRLRLEAAEVGASTAGDRVIVTLPLPEPPPAAPQAHYFTVRTAGPRGDVAEHSNPVVLAPRTPPEPPLTTRVTPQGGGVLIEWTPPPGVAAAPPAAALGAEPATGGEPQAGDQPPTAAQPPTGAEPTGGAQPTPDAPPATGTEPGAVEPPAEAPPAASGPPAASAPPAPAAPAGIAGFNVYRRSSRERSFGAPLQAVGPDQTSFLDATARFGESYIYAVTTVAQRSPLIESGVRSEHEVRYQDRFAPPPPREPVALVESGRVRLVWRASAAPDLAGYLVYRSDAGGPFARLTERPIAEVELTDSAVAPGGSYTYRVTAVDQGGNESEPSEAAVTVERSPG